MKHKVLFVDDEPRVTDTLKRVLRQEPYEIFSACSAAEALELLACQPIDVIISDEMMPGMSGSEFIVRVRELYPDTVRIMLTGHATLEVALRAINQGEIYRFFTKPCQAAELSITIHQALQQRALLMESRRLLRTVRQQSTLLQTLEKSYPGLTKVERDSSGAILIEEDDADIEKLLKQIDSELGKCKDIFK